MCACACACVWALNHASMRRYDAQKCVCTRVHMFAGNWPWKHEQKCVARLNMCTCVRVCVCAEAGSSLRVMWQDVAAAKQQGQERWLQAKGRAACWAIKPYKYWVFEVMIRGHPCTLTCTHAQPGTKPPCVAIPSADMHHRLQHARTTISRMHAATSCSMKVRTTICSWTSCRQQ